jgi:lysophospholipase L1-like esterase
VKRGLRSGRGLLKNIGLSAVSLLIFLVLAEAASQLALGGSPGPTHGVRDPWVGFRLRSHHAYTEVGGARVRTNSRGFRGGEVSADRSPRGVRILAVGDSSTFGYGARDDETYPAVLQRLLSKRFPGRSVEVINAGTPGWSSGNGAAFLAREGLAWKPDAVLIYFGYNEQLGSGPGAPHYDYDPALRRVLFHPLGEAVRTFVDPPAPDAEEPRETFLDRFRRFPRRTKLFLFLGRVKGSFHNATGRILGWAKSSDLAGWLLRWIYEREPERIHGALRLPIAGNHVVEAYGTHLEEMVRLCREAGAPPLILLQPRRAYREFLDFLPVAAREANLRAIAMLRRGGPGGAAGAVRILEDAREGRSRDAITLFNLSVAYRGAGRDADADRALEGIFSIRSFTLNAVADRAGARLGVPRVNLPLAFLASRRDDLFFPDRYHTRAAGYALLAEEVERVLSREGLLEGAPRDS